MCGFAVCRLAFDLSFGSWILDSIRAEDFVVTIITLFAKDYGIHVEMICRSVQELKEKSSFNSFDRP